jgi:hypothetical protein
MKFEVVHEMHQENIPKAMLYAHRALLYDYNSLLHAHRALLYKRNSLLHDDNV